MLGLMVIKKIIKITVQTLTAHSIDPILILVKKAVPTAEFCCIFAQILKNVPHRQVNLSERLVSTHEAKNYPETRYRERGRPAHWPSRQFDFSTRT
jgi:hypothetical protein